jgi:hypothetical protein
VIKICVFPVEEFVDLGFRLGMRGDEFVGFKGKVDGLTRLLKQITGQRLSPSEQQQQTQPKQSLSNELHNYSPALETENTLTMTIAHHLTLIGRFFFRTELIREIVALYSSGAIFDMSCCGNSVLNLLERPKLRVGIKEIQSTARNSLCFGGLTS